MSETSSIQFRPILWLSVFQESLLVIVMTINASEKRNCEGGFWASEVACLWKAQRPTWTEYILQTLTQQNYQRDNTHCFHISSTLATNVTFTLTSKHSTWVYLKAFLVPTKHKPIAFKFIHQLLNVFALFSFAASHKMFAQRLLTLSTSQNKIAHKGLLWPKPNVNIPNIFDRFYPWTWDFKVRIGKNTED